MRLWALPVPRFLSSFWDRSRSGVGATDPRWLLSFSGEAFGLRAPAEQLRERSGTEVRDCLWIVDVTEVGRRQMRSLELEAASHLLVARRGIGASA